MHHTTTSSWGEKVVVEEVLGSPCRVFAQRPKHLGELLWWGAQHGERTCLIQGDRRLSFAQLAEAIDAVAGTLHRQGLQAGDRILLAGANSIEWVVTFWACLCHGWVLVPVNAWWSPEELAHAAGLVGARLAVADTRRRARLPNDLACLELESILPQPIDAKTDGGALAVPLSTTEDDPAMVLFTSGTTSFARGAVLTHRNLLANLHNLLAIAGRLPGSPEATRNPAVTLMTMPLFHVGGIQQVFTALLSGATLVFTEGRFSPEGVLKVMADEGVTGWAAVPTMLSRVLEVVEKDPGRLDVSTLRTLVIGGSQVSESLRARARSAFPRTAARGLGTSYGLTEISGVAATAAGQVVAERPGTVGRPLPTVELRIEPVDTRSDDSIGEVLVRSPGVMLGYWGCDDDPIVTPDRWVHTGDLGRLDDDGYLYIVGRAKDVVIRGGENISTVRVEERLGEHPAVREVVVVGLPHEDLGEELAAAVVLHPGSAVDEDDLANFASENLAYFSVPTSWWFIDHLPKNATGKVLKSQIVREWGVARASQPN
ncbi:hypothetical protein AWC05_02505 [Mycobacterium florentinum]|uniref:AMP-dependent synthetase n=1 Tax=Mycobacterium florentinum TaxID=292462 RepID=A0A1X1TWV9_MYCFL|nr:class I adenylate-forming enzyme family protein [Mycobacterium florentinum]MCV7413533.1 acyl--CoA ligase [Mycobacterium florentinum]ORV49064.1 hypothetical protein AWC05_02505 [Mycobacterium florentinum]